MSKPFKYSQILPLVRTSVRNMLQRTPSYHAMSKPDQDRIERNTVKTAAFMIGGHKGKTIPASAILLYSWHPSTGNDLPGAPLNESDLLANQVGENQFAKLIAEVDFPEFVADLIAGVFQAIVDSSIKQMEAYKDLVSSVAKTVDNFKKENLSEDSARDCLDRQQNIATMVLMGINRIVVTNGEINAKVSFEGNSEHCLSDKNNH